MLWPVTARAMDKPKKDETERRLIDLSMQARAVSHVASQSLTNLLACSPAVVKFITRCRPQFDASNPRFRRPPHDQRKYRRAAAEVRP